MTTPRTWYAMDSGSGGSPARIDLYDEIGGWGIGAAQFKAELSALGDVAALDVHIHSPGGSVIEGTAIYNILRDHKARKVCTVDGLAASMASVVAMACDEIRMPSNALMMVHNPWMSTAGDADQLRNDADFLDKLANGIRGAYARKTGKSDDDIRAIMDAETWMDGNEALAAGFCDSVTDPLAVAAKLDLSRVTAKADPRLAALMEAKHDSDPPGHTAPAPPPPVVPDASLLRAEYDRGLSDGRSARTAEIETELAAASASVTEAQKRVAECEAATAAANAARDAANLERDGANERAAAAQASLEAAQKRQAVMLSAFRFEPEVTWTEALAKCGGKYADARRQFPESYAAFMAAKENRNGRAKK